MAMMFMTDEFRQLHGPSGFRQPVVHSGQRHATLCDATGVSAEALRISGDIGDTTIVRKCRGTGFEDGIWVSSFMCPSNTSSP